MQEPVFYVTGYDEVQLSFRDASSCLRNKAETGSEDFINRRLTASSQLRIHLEGFRKDNPPPVSNHHKDSFGAVEQDTALQIMLIVPNSER